MKRTKPLRNSIVAAVIIAALHGMPVFAQTAQLDALFERLQNIEGSGWEQVEESIWQEWSKSGSAAMDLLLERGRKAMTAGETDVAIAHFSALIDHAPEFAEGWNARATAFFSKGQFGLSLADIRTTLALNPRHFGALSGLALILEEMDYPRDALEAYRAVQAIHPHRPNVKDAIERLEKKVSGQSL